MSRNHSPFCGRVNRRGFLSGLGLGFGSLAAGQLLAEDHADSVSKLAIQAKAKNVIWVFLSGGVSHLETFDPKPLLNKFAGKTFDETGLTNPQSCPSIATLTFGSGNGPRSHLKDHAAASRLSSARRKWHRSQRLATALGRVVDDLCIIRSMYTTDNDHNAEFQFHTGRHSLDEQQPTIGSWISYGLGSINENLPRFVFLGSTRTRASRETSMPTIWGQLMRASSYRSTLPIHSPFGKRTEVLRQPNNRTV